MPSLSFAPFATVALLTLVAAQTAAYAQETPDNKPTPTFGEKLEERRISEFADRSRNVFGRSVDFTIDYAHSANDTISDFSPVSSRSNSLGISMAGGLSDRVGYSLSMNRANTRLHEGQSSFGSSNALLGKQMNSSGSAGLSYSILPETAKWPSLSGSVSVGRQLSQGEHALSKGMGFRFSRNLESSALFGGVSMNWVGDTEVSPSSKGWSADLGVALVVNHRLSISGTVNVSKGNQSVTQLGVGGGVNYGIDEDLILSGGLGTNLTGSSNSPTLSISLTQTLGSKL